MTETEAYKVLGWPIEGKGFILPGTGEGNWTPYKCNTCTWKEIQRRVLLTPRCPVCKTFMNPLETKEDIIILK